MNRGPYKVLRGEDGRTAFEAVLAAIIILLLLFAALGYYSSIRPVKEQALTIELSNLRRAVNYYAFLNRKLPGSLKDLIDSDIIVTKTDIEGREHSVRLTGKYVEAMELDAEGYPTDPFGNRFAYDSVTGKVSSSTTGYETW